MKKKSRITYRHFQIVTLVALSVFLIIEAFRQCDFNIFFTAGKDILIGENLYTKIYQGWLHYYYSPFFALSLSPFTFFSEYVITLLWLVLNVYFFYRIWGILSDWLELNLLPISTQRWFFWGSVILCVQGIRDNLHYHQITIMMIYLTLQGLDLVLKKKEWQGGALIALGINIKILPIVFFPYLIYRGYWKGALSVVLFWILLLFLPAVFIGWEYNSFLLSEWWNGINPSQKENVLDFSRAGFGSLVTALFHSQSGETRPIFITQLSIEAIVFITNGLRLFLAVFTLYFLRTLPFQKVKSNLHRLWEVGYLFLVIPFLFPHQQNYAYFFVYPAVVYLMYYFYVRIKKRGFLILLSLKDKILLGILGGSYLMMSLELFLGEFRTFYIDIRLMTWAAILILIVYSYVAVCFSRPKKRD
ncbi:MAG: glycosyltransferase family 87 protein [Saprospiraceae bacterium]